VLRVLRILAVLIGWRELLAGRGMCELAGRKALVWEGSGVVAGLAGGLRVGAVDEVFQRRDQTPQPRGRACRGFATVHCTNRCAY
jgi:hypothetical protein